MDYEKEMAKLGVLLDNIPNMPDKSGNRKRFDKVGFVYDLKQILDNLNFFYKTIVPAQSGEAETSFYHLHDISPQEHQMIYVNLARTYPRELFGGHYCYILKKYPHQYIVIPATSVGDPSQDSLHDFEIDISVKGLEKAMRLNLVNIRGIDLQRINKKKGIHDVITERHAILESIAKKICSA